MTFSLSLADSIEGQRLYRRSRNRFAALMPGFFGVMVLLFAWYAWANVDVVMAGAAVYLVGFLIYDSFWRPLRFKANFRRNWGGDWAPPIIYEFSEEGFVLHAKNGESKLLWTHLKGRLEGPTVWVFLLPVAAKRRIRGVGAREKIYLLVIPKSAMQTPEGAREWAVVDAHFARPAGPPIAAPGS